MPMKGKSGPCRLAVLSVDGMRPDFYRRPQEFGLKIPNLLELVKSGASADAVESIYPTTTYPAHATLVTGVPPSVHGIYSHLASLDPTEKARPWCWFASALRVPAVWDVVRATGRKAAAISWPVSAGAAIDYNIPEIWDPAMADYCPNVFPGNRDAEVAEFWRDWWPSWFSTSTGRWHVRRWRWNCGRL